ncbi:MAG TPA: tetratricopeptide repeat protein [Thermoanaerobaculia bacterium]
MIRSFRSLIIAILALWKRLSQKEVGVRSGIPPKYISDLLKKPDLKDEVYDRLLAGVQGRPAEVALVTSALEGLQALQADPELTPEERDVVEMGVLEAARRFREVLREAVRRSRAMPALDDYPKPNELEPARWHAGQLWSLLKILTEDQQLAVVRVAREFQSWALLEKVCEEAVQAASKDLKRASFLARLGREIAEQVRGPQGWRNRVRGFAAAFAANVLRVQGELKAAEAAFEPARQLWLAGSDPDGVLDPGRLLDLEASLLRDQRHFQQALDRLDEAIEVGRSQGRYLVKKGFTLEVMGDYESAVDTLLRAEPEVQKQGDPRLLSMQRLNLAVNYCHTGRYEETRELVQQGREIAAELGDEIGLIRAIWLDGRIAAGLGRTQEALSLLAPARREFATREMWADAALALLEEAALLLDERRTAEVKELSPELTVILKSKGLHREALAALRLFQEAIEHETATAELARRVLRYLFRARYDQGLRFES